MTPDALRSSVARFGIAREPAAEDAVDGVVPGQIVEPESFEALAAVLAWASQEGLSVVLCGGGTKLGWGRRPAPIDIVLSTRRLNRILAHAHGDLTATVEAGATLRDVNQELGRRGQWLPIDATHDESTIGGAIATNDSGPLRQRHGTPRDLLIGVHLATTDGRIVKAGGNVVKNVAGYDLGKLLSGSFGGLAAIASATFKLAPLPSASATAVASFRDVDALARAVAAISASQLEPAAFELRTLTGPAPRTPVYRLICQFASTQPAVDAQMDALRRLAAADTCEPLAGAAERDLWHEHRRAVWTAPGAIVRASWLPASLVGLVALAEVVGHRAAVEIVGRAGVGAGLIRIDGDTGATIDAVARLRTRPDVVGHVVLLRAAPEVKQRVDVWGPPRDDGALLRAVKRAFDPRGILNAGRGPL